MGWFYGNHSRADLVRELTERQENEHSIQTCTNKFFSGNNLWCVFERQSKHSSTDVEKFLIVFLMRRAGSDWGYKPVEESMGPCELSCPLAFLDIVPDPGGFATTWRERVRADHARRSQKLAAGQVIKLTNGQDYTVTKVAGFNKIYGTDSRGCEYRIPRRMLTVQS